MELLDFRNVFLGENQKAVLLYGSSCSVAPLKFAGVMSAASQFCCEVTLCLEVYSVYFRRDLEESEVQV